MNAFDSILKFEEHTVCLVSQVWRELDKHKKDRNERGYNCRRAAHLIDQLTSGKKPEELLKGIPLIPPPELVNGKSHTGKLILDFSKPEIPSDLNIDLSLDEPDDRIILVCLRLKKEGRRVVLVSNDANCRVRAVIAGIEAEEYLGDTTTIVSEEVGSTGIHHLPIDFWNNYQGDLVESREDNINRYYLNDPIFKKINCNNFLIFPDNLKLIVREKKGREIVAEPINHVSKGQISGIIPRNLEQECALHLLTDTSIPAVSLAGLAGSGKTFLTIGAALHLVFDTKEYEKIIFTRPVIGSDEDIGFLPGTEEEKMNPWMGALHDNLEFLLKNKKGSDGLFEKNTDHESTMFFLKSKIQTKSLNFIKGRTINNAIIIVDEAQDLSPKKLKMIATRVAESSKIIFLGNAAQIDDNFLSEYTCGISVFIRSFADSNLVGSITLQKGERGPFATEAEKRL